ncbi:MAG: hypothetical protein IPP94_00320 [Ignavibacteria bacterium]|nr:hypothetical protein [Ignavibacteria bacterium]
MVRKRRVELFFILYITAVAAFVIVSKQREAVDQRVDVRYRQIVETFIRPARMHFESDTLFHYVDAGQSGLVARGAEGLETTVYLDDISPEDTAVLTLVSVARDNALISPSTVRIGGRRGVGELHDNRIAFPVRCRFSRTGAYTLTFEARTTRVHAQSDSLLRYRGVVFPADILPAASLESIETATASLAIRVEDTSYANMRDRMRLRVEAEKSEVASAIGTEVDNLFTVTHSYPAPTARIVRGGGVIESVTRSTSQTAFLWRGTPTRGTDTVTVEFRVEKSGRLMDVSRQSFAVTGVEPFLQQHVPDVVYAGEELHCALNVAGLTVTQAYRWELSEVTGDRVISRKDSGTGPHVAYVIPNNFANKTLRIRGFYNNAPYACISPRSHQRGLSVFTLRVIEPPTHIRFEPPVHPTLLEIFPLTAYRYNTPETKNWRPVPHPDSVRVTMRMFDPKKSDKDIEYLPVTVTMTEPGRFHFSIRRNIVALKNPVRVLVTIRAFEAELEREFTLYND